MHPCPQCEYDLTGLPEVHNCPECGFAYDPHTTVFKLDAQASAGPILFVAFLLIGVPVALTLLSSGRTQQGWLFVVPVALALLLTYARDARWTKCTLIVNREGIKILAGAKPDLHVPWSRLREVRQTWGAIRIVDSEGRKIVVCPSRYFYPFGSGRRCADEIRRLQTLYASPTWRERWTRESAAMTTPHARSNAST